MWWSLTSLTGWINENEKYAGEKANLLPKHEVKNENNKGKTGENKRRERSRGRVTAAGTDGPFTSSSLSAAITMTRGRQQGAPKACVTLADSYVDMEADTVHKQSWRDCFQKPNYKNSLTEKNKHTSRSQIKVAGWNVQNK